MTRPSWDFHYVPAAGAILDDDRAAPDLIVATETDVDPALIAGALASLGTDVEIEPLLSLHPLFWTRVRAGNPVDRAELALRVESTGVRVRYVASSRHCSTKPAPTLDLSSARPRHALRWQEKASPKYQDPRTRGRWFLEDEGVSVDRAICGIGDGTRLAIIDNDAGGTGHLELDAEVLVGISDVPRGSQHAALMAGLAVGAYPDTMRSRFVAGVAPGASLRLYLIPKPGAEVFTLPLALVRAVDDGADVVVCATYVEGQASPMLDDALEFARYLGRSGRGTAIVFPTGREIASSANSVHASLSLAFGDPACDPRVFCVGPSGRDGGWFLWRDRRGRLRPFANRGPSVRWLAPGDDVASPLSETERLTHSESSGASAVAAGVLLLVLGINPDLSLCELDALLSRTATPVPLPGPSEHAEVADPHDVLPYGRDLDGHDAKHGYGRLHASRACLGAADPFAYAMISMGESSSALKWMTLRRREQLLAFGYSARLAAWAARVVVTNATLLHAACVVVRHTRLVADDPERLRSHYSGAVVRQLALLGRSLLAHSWVESPSELTDEARRLVEAARLLNRAESDVLELAICSLAAELWPNESGTSPTQTVTQPASAGSRRLSAHKLPNSDWKTA
jgi:hypothetical protein